MAIQEILEVNELARSLFKQYRITRAAVFGSFARGNVKKNSDIDMLVSFEAISMILEQVISIFDTYIGRRYLRDRQKIFINYVGKDLKMPWKEFSI